MALVLCSGASELCFCPPPRLTIKNPHPCVSQSHCPLGRQNPSLQVRYYSPYGPGAAEGLSEGEVLLSNHPQLAGGSHLPDITVITPVFR